MATHHNNEEPLQELKHEAVPGYMKAFCIAFAVMALYLAIILISSPGPVGQHHGDDHSGNHHQKNAAH